jgi:hypothetical protein
VLHALHASLLAVAIVSGGANDDGCWKLTRLVTGCIDLPCGYEVTVTESGVDIAAGYIQPPEDNWRVNWLFGMWGRLLEPGPNREVVWKKSGTINGRTIAIGEVLEGNVRLIAIEDGIMQFTIPAKLPRAESLLTALVSRYLHGTRPDCEGPNSEKGN